MRPAIIPAVTNDDRLPHDQAVWREEAPTVRTGGFAVSVDYGGGLVEQTYGHLVDWSRVVRWRFGWAPA